MDLPEPDLGSPSRLRALLDHFALIEDTREPHRVAYPLQEVLLLVVCATMADCDDYDHIAAWGEAHLGFLRRHLPYEHGTPGGRWLTILMNRVNPALFSACFTAWVKQCWPDRPELIAIDGKTSRRSHDRATGAAPLHLVSAFATTSRLVLAQEAVPDKANELAAIPVLLDRLGVDGGLEGAMVSIDAIACNGTVAKAVRGVGADYLLAVKANQPTLRGARRFPGELRLPRCRLRHQGGGQDRTQGPLPLRHPVLYLLRVPHGHQSSRDGQGALGHRKFSPLGARRDFQRRPVQDPKRTRCQEHGCRPPLRHQPRPPGRDLPAHACRAPPAAEKSSATQTRQPQAETQNGRMGHNHPDQDPRRCTPLTWIRSPVQTPAFRPGRDSGADAARLSCRRSVGNGSGTSR